MMYYGSLASRWRSMSLRKIALGGAAGEAFDVDARWLRLDGYCLVWPVRSKLVRIPYWENTSQWLFTKLVWRPLSKNPNAPITPIARPISSLNRRDMIILILQKKSELIKCSTFVREHNHVEKNAQSYKVSMFWWQTWYHTLVFHTPKNNRSLFELLLLVWKNK